MKLPTPILARTTAMVSAALLLAGSALGQDAAKPDSPLQGPKVTDRNVPGATPDFGMGAAGRRFADRVPPEVFRQALAVLTAEDASADLRASPEQRAKLREYVEGFEAQSRTFRREHARELEELRRAAGELPARRRGADAPAPDSMQEMSEQDQKARDAARVKLRELQAKAPKMEDVYTKVWAELSDPQRAAVQAKLDEWREQQAQKREDDYVRRQTRERDAKPATPAPPSASKDSPMTEPAMESDKAPQRPRARQNAEQNTRRERLLRMFNQLSPEEQEQLLQRLEARVAERRNGAPAPARRKASPDVDRVKVPEPEPDSR